MKNNTKTTAMEALTAAIMTSKNPGVLPKFDSRPEFFVNTTPSPLHQPVKSPARAFQKVGVVTVEMPLIGEQQIPISAGYLVNATHRFHLYTHGLN